MQNYSVEYLRHLILKSAATGNDSVIVTKDSGKLFYYQTVSETLLADGFVLEPPAFLAPVPIKIQWGHWRGITQHVRISELQKKNAINGHNMFWLSQPIGQQFIKKIKQHLPQSKILDSFSENFSDYFPKIDLNNSDEFIELNFSYNLKNFKLIGVPACPDHLMDIIAMLD